MKKFIFIAVIILFLSFLLINFWPLFQAQEIAANLNKTEPVYLYGRTLFISDLHLESLSQIDTQFDVDNLIIVGDLFDTPQDFSKLGESTEEIFQKVVERLVLPDSLANIYFILSHDRIHDPYLPELELEFDKIDFYCLGTEARFIYDEIQIFAIHGDQINKTGVVPCAIFYFSKLLGKPLILENFWRNLVELDKDSWLITGHSHLPAIDYQNKIANCGSLVGVPLSTILKIPIKTGILFEGEEVRLIQY